MKEERKEIEAALGNITLIELYITLIQSYIGIKIIKMAQIAVG